MKNSEPADVPCFYNYLPDDLDMCSLVAFTLSPDPRKYGTTDPIKQYALLLTRIFGNSKAMCATFRDYYFVPEINDNGNVHIHGYYVIKDLVKYYRWFVPACKRWISIPSCLVIKTKRITYDWVEYCHKDFMKNIDLFGKLPYPIQNGSNFVSMNVMKRHMTLVPAYKNRNGVFRKQSILKYILNID